MTARTGANAASILSARSSNPLDKSTLRQEEQHDDRGDEHCGARPQPGPLAAVDRQELLQAVRQSVLIRIVDVEQRPEEVDPGPDELKERTADQGRDGQRQNDLPEDTKLTGPVDTGGLG